MVLLRRLIGDVLRRHRIRQSRTLRDVSSAAGVSLGYLSEVERGRKEASSELLGAICGALDVPLSDLLREVSDDLAREERGRRLVPVGFAAATLPRPVAGLPPMLPGRLQPTVQPAVARPLQRPSVPVAMLDGDALARSVAAA